MKTKKDATVEPAVHSDSSTSHETSLRGLSDQVTDARWLRMEKLLETAGPAEILEKPVLLRDGRWLTAEEVVEYAKTLEEHSDDN